MKILVTNALNGSVALAAKKKYPGAEIWCSEYFPYYKDMLSKLGFNLIDLEKETTMIFDQMLSNPPYQPMSGVKRGGNEYKKHVLKGLNIAKAGVFIVPMTWMIQDPFDKSNLDFKHKLLDAGIKYVKHLHPDTFNVNVLTVEFVWEKGYTGPVTFDVYSVDDVNQYNTVTVDRAQLYTMPIWPVVRSQTELDLAVKIQTFLRKKSTEIKSDPSKKADWCVEWEYLIGLEKNRLNRQKNLRKVSKRGPTDTVRGGSLSRFVNVSTEAEADSLVAYLESEGQAWQRMIPRGSSVENWMMIPLIEKWLAEKDT